MGKALLAYFEPSRLKRYLREVPREVRLDAYGAGSVSVENENEKVSFALGESLQFAGRHLLASLLAARG